MCQQETEVDVGKIKKWALDCLHCLKINPQVKVSMTILVRKETSTGLWHLATSWSDFEPAIYKMIFTYPNDENNTFVWIFNLEEKRMELQRIEKDCHNPVVHTFDQILDINLTNVLNKTKTCLLFA